MKKFTFKLKHDNGIINISTYGKNIASAVQQIINNEGCPEDAIQEITIEKIDKEKPTLIVHHWYLSQYEKWLSHQPWELGKKLLHQKAFAKTINPKTNLGIMIESDNQILYGQNI